MAISATTPVVTQPTPGITYDSWFITQLVGKFSPSSAPTIVTLTRASQNSDGSWTLMPNTTPNSTVTFNVDILKEMSSTNTDAPLMTVAWNAMTFCYRSLRNS